MSFRERYIFRMDIRHIRLAAILFIVSGTMSVVLAQTADGAIEVAGKLAQMEAAQLFALVALVSMALCAWMFYRLSGTTIKQAEALAKLATELENRPCFKERDR
jgi:hypothetical protein